MVPYKINLLTLQLTSKDLLAYCKVLLWLWKSKGRHSEH